MTDLQEYEKGTLFTLWDSAVIWASNDLNANDEIGLLSTGDVVIPIVVRSKVGLIQVLSRLGVGWINLGVKAGPTK